MRDDTEALAAIGRLALDERKAWVAWLDAGKDHKQQAAWWRAQDAVYTAVAAFNAKHGGA